MSTLMIGYDGAPGSAAAMRLCAALRRPRDEICAVHVLDDGRSVVHGPWSERGESEERSRHDTADALLTRVEADAREIVRARSPARGLHDAAVAHGAELLAIGATSRGRFGRMLPGSVAHDLLHASPCPVVEVPTAWAETPTRVSVAYDASPEAEQALEAGVELARRLECQLRVLGVADPMPADMLTVASPEIERSLSRLVTSRSEEPRSRVPSSEVQVVTGSVARTILDEMDPANDMLVMGSRGYGALTSVVVGSVARFVIDHAPCPVMVTPRGRALGGRPDEVRAAAGDRAGS